MTTKKTTSGVTRRGFFKTAAVASTAAAFPHIWIPNTAVAQTVARGQIKHLLYVRLNGGYRFPVAFNADVGEQFNPFGAADSRAEGTEWGVGELLTRAGYITDELAGLGMRSVPEISNQMAVIPCVDHEPFAGSADGNHGTGLERYYTGYVGGDTGIFTMINYGLREQVAEATANGETLLPAVSLSGSGIGLGFGEYGAYRPPVINNDFDGFGFDASANLPDWAQSMALDYDQGMLDAQHVSLRAPVDAYRQTREATAEYSAIFNSDTLKIRNNSDELVDGISNRQLQQIFGDSGAARNMRLALRLFHFGCPAVYMGQGGYDMHSGEQNNLPGRHEELNRLISALEVSLKMMEHPSGGTYWDHTMIVFGSEFGRSARGNRFNSAQGSDHGGDYATRWMSMPFMGGLITQAGMGGRVLGETDAADLSAKDRVYSYRSVVKTLMDGLGCDHSEFFPADEPFNDLFGA